MNLFLKYKERTAKLVFDYGIVLMWLCLRLYNQIIETIVFEDSDEETKQGELMVLANKVHD
jgi:hypothetical protein